MLAIRRKALPFLALGMLLGVCLSSNAAGADQGISAPEIKIGIIAPMTGRSLPLALKCGMAST